MAAVLLAAFSLLLAADKRAERPSSPPALAREHRHPSGAFRFRTPEDWRVAPLPGRPDVVEAAGAGVRIRFIHHPGEAGYDSLHGTCMLERLVDPMQMSADIRYEYDYLSSGLGPLRALDSAFRVRYDQPVDGQREWRQRNLTVVGSGQSLCIVGFTPAALWKKSQATRTLVDAVVGSIELR